MAVTRISEFTAAEGKAAALQELLQSLVPYILSSPGCLACEVLRQQGNDHCFMVIEQWDNIESHVQSVKNFPEDGMQSATALLARPPTGHYYTASE